MQPEKKLTNTFGVEGAFEGDEAFPEQHMFEERDGRTYYRSYSLLPNFEARDAVVATGMEKGSHEVADAARRPGRRTGQGDGVMSISADTTGIARASVTRIGAGVGFAGGLASLAVLAALHVMRPDLYPGGHVVSEYGVGSSVALGAAFFAAQSLGCLGLAVALFGRASSLGLRAGIALLLLAALELGMAVFFPIDPLTTPPGEETYAGMMHGVAALIGIPSFIAATLVLAYALRKRSEWQSLAAR